MLCAMRPEPAPGPRVLWVASAWGRGHLMRAHLMRQELPGVDVVTTSREGVAFLADMGTPSWSLSRSYQLTYDARQNLRRGRTAAATARYVATDYARDAAVLTRVARGYDLVVNDFHPSVMGAPITHGLDVPVVHVHGEHLWRAIAAPFKGTPWEALDHIVSPAVHALREAGAARLVHDPLAPLDGVTWSGREARLPPIVASPTRSARRVRDALGVQGRLVVAYLNPYVRDPRVAASIEDACDTLGATLYGVSEPFDGRPRWRRTDPNLVDVIAAADAFVSSASMGAIGQSRARGVPLLMLGCDQPEQRGNAEAFLSLDARPAAEVAPLGAPLTAPLGCLLDAPRHHTITPHAPALWADVLTRLVRNR